MSRVTRIGLLAAMTVVPLTLAAQSGEVRIGGMLLSSRQNVVSGAGLDQASGSISGAEFLVRNEGVGLYGRYLTGKVGELSALGPDGRFRMLDGRLMIGPPVFNLEGGVALRARSGSLAEPRDLLFRAGARSTIWLGPSGFSLTVAASALARSERPENSPNKKLRIVGWEATTAVFYQLPRLPIYAMLGYRYERLRASEEAAAPGREELSAIVLGAGLRHLSFRRATR